MPHLDPDTLALLALGEAVATDADTAHLAGCPLCRDEIEALALTVRVGRHTLSNEALAVPHERVWSAISSELALRRRGRRPQIIALVAAVTVLALVVGGSALWWSLRPTPPSDTLVASATLDAFPDWPTATGSAMLVEHPDGTRTVTVTLEAPPVDGAYREAWLITSDAAALVSLGVMRESTRTFTLPAGVDTARFDLVDVSQEADDGNPAHSGNSIVRGRLEGGTIEG